MKYGLYVRRGRRPWTPIWTWEDARETIEEAKEYSEYQLGEFAVFPFSISPFLLKGREALWASEDSMRDDLPSAVHEMIDRIREDWYTKSNAIRQGWGHTPKTSKQGVITHFRSDALWAVGLPEDEQRSQYAFDLALAAIPEGDKIDVLLYLYRLAQLLDMG